MLNLDSLAYVTVCHKFCHIALHTPPPILVSKVHIHLGDSRVDGLGRVVDLIHDGVSIVTLLGHTQSLLEPQNPILIQSKILGLIFSSLGFDLHQLRIILLGFLDLIVWDGVYTEVEVK
jgi:hypothetical protein